MPTQHIIIGGGPAATNAVETIRQFESELSNITLICDEPAHSRMALPYWLAGNIPREHTHTGDADYFRITTNQQATPGDSVSIGFQRADGDLELAVVDDDTSAVINVTVNGVSYVATNNGDGTWTLADDTIAACSRRQSSRMPTGAIAS